MVNIRLHRNVVTQKWNEINAKCDATVNTLCSRVTSYVSIAKKKNKFANGDKS